MITVIADTKDGTPTAYPSLLYKSGQRGPSGTATKYHARVHCNAQISLEHADVAWGALISYDTSALNEVLIIVDHKQPEFVPR